MAIKWGQNGDEMVTKWRTKDEKMAIKNGDKKWQQNGEKKTKKNMKKRR